MIPKFQDFLYPFLDQFREKDTCSKQEITNALVLHFHLTEEDKALRTRSGSALQLQDRIGWCRQWLRRALFIDVLTGSNYRITQRGKDYLLTHTDLRQENLLQYPEFAAYARPNHSKDNVPDKINEDIELTPTDKLEQAFESIQKDLAEDLLDKVLQQSPKFFELLVVDLLGRMGYGYSVEDSSEVTQYSHDGGIDGIIKEDKLGLDKVFIQAKRYNLTNHVQKPELQKFVGALDENNSDKGVFITTSDFSDGARKYVEKSSKKIVLINGNTLVHYMIEYNVGVSVKKEYIVKKIDNDYFEE